MARIHYGLAGEGRGHAVRAQTLIELLAPHHRITVHAPGDAHRLLAPLHERTPNVEIERVEGLRWSYDSRGRVDHLRSTLASCGYLKRLPATIAGLAERLRRTRADLVISDFEPALSRAAVRAGVPLVAVDHQAFLTTSDLGALPRALRRHARFLGWFVARWAPEPRLRVVSSFYRPPLRASVGPDVRQTGVLLRRAVREATPSHGGFLLAYLRPGAPECALDVLRRAPLEVRLYGRGTGPREASLVRKPADDGEFLVDLAACEAVVSTAGNQLVGEALFLGKPVLAAPEPGNREQEINAWFLARTGAGVSTTFDAFDDATLAAFLARRDVYARAARAADVDGTRAAINAVEEALARFTAAPRRAASEWNGLRTSAREHASLGGRRTA